MTNIVYRCPKCKEIVYKYKKEEPLSDLVKGCNVAVHMWICDRERFDRILQENF